MNFSVTNPQKITLHLEVERWYHVLADQRAVSRRPPARVQNVPSREKANETNNGVTATVADCATTLKAAAVLGFFLPICR